MPAAPDALRRRLAPLRVRLTVAFASVMAIVLALTAFLIQAQFAQDLTQRTDAELADHQTAMAAAMVGRTPQQALALLGEPLAQVYAATAGGVVASTARVEGIRLASPAQVRGAATGAKAFTTHVVGVSDDGARVRLFPLASGQVAAVAEDLETREHALRRLALLLAIGMPLALIAASLTGYQVAKAALAPVEQMRSRASEIGAGDLTQRLPVPATEDEVQRLAETINDLLGRLESALERERRIVGDASHELRTPISVLRARVGFALRGDPSATQLREVLEGVDRDAARLATLADDLLVLARADQGALALRRDPLDVQELLDAAARRSQAVDPAANVQVRIEIDGGAVVLGDETRIEQLLDNLLANARRYGRTPITLVARQARGDRQEPDAIAIDVTDAGDGFPVDFLPRAFDRFSQSDPAHGGDGTGLGLAIVQAITTAHGGHVTAGNAASGGARITLELPAA